MSRSVLSWQKQLVKSNHYNGQWMVFCRTSGNYIFTQECEIKYGSYENSISTTHTYLTRKDANRRVWQQVRIFQGGVPCSPTCTCHPSFCVLLTVNIITTNEKRPVLVLDVFDTNEPRLRHDTEECIPRMWAFRRKRFPVTVLTKTQPSSSSTITNPHKANSVVT